MMLLNTIYTETELTVAFEEATKMKKSVLIDFWSTGCKGCQKMEDITYKDQKIEEYINQQFVFVKYNTYNPQPGFRNTYISSPYLWTPTFVVFSSDGSEVRKITGFLSPEQFFNEMEIGRALAALRKARSAEALSIFDELIKASNCHDTKQEALYWAGVAAFYAKQKSINALEPYWHKLIADYPGSRWTERADCLNVELTTLA